jgi:hypothetical protein
MQIADMKSVDAVVTSAVDWWTIEPKPSPQNRMVAPSCDAARCPSCSGAGGCPLARSSITWRGNTSDRSASWASLMAATICSRAVRRVTSLWVRARDGLQGQQRRR